MVSNRPRRDAVRCPESDCRGGCEKIANKSFEPHKLWRWWLSLIAADSAARHILFGGGGVAHSQLAAEFGGSGL